MTSVKTFSYCFLFVLSLSGVTSWTIDLPEVRRYFWDKKKGGEHLYDADPNLNNDNFGYGNIIRQINDAYSNQYAQEYGHFGYPQGYMEGGYQSVQGNSQGISQGISQGLTPQRISQGLSPQGNSYGLSSQEYQQGNPYRVYQGSFGPSRTSSLGAHRGLLEDHSKKHSGQSYHGFPIEPFLGIGVHQGYSQEKSYGHSYGHSYMEKQLNEVVRNGSEYLEGLRTAVVRYKEILENCTNMGLTPINISTSASVPRGMDMPVQNLLELDQYNRTTCARVTRDRELARRYADLALSVTHDLQELDVAGYYKVRSTEEENELVLRLAWFLEKLAQITGYDPNLSGFASTKNTYTSTTTAAPSNPMEMPMPDSVKMAMMECVMQNSSVPATQRCSFPLPMPPFMRQLFNLSDTSSGSIEQASGSTESPPSSAGESVGTTIQSSRPVEPSTPTDPTTGPINPSAGSSSFTPSSGSIEASVPITGPRPEDMRTAINDCLQQNSPEQCGFPFVTSPNGIQGLNMTGTSSSTATPYNGAYAPPDAVRKSVMRCFQLDSTGACAFPMPVARFMLQMFNMTETPSTPAPSLPTSYNSTEDIRNALADCLQRNSPEQCGFPMSMSPYMTLLFNSTGNGTQLQSNINRNPSTLPPANIGQGTPPEQSVQSSKLTEILLPVENNALSKLPPLSAVKSIRKRSIEDPMLRVVKYYVKHKLWEGSNVIVDKNIDSDKVMDVNNKLPVKSLEKRSTSYQNAIEVKIPEDPFQDISKNVKHHAKVDYKIDYNTKDNIKEYLGKIDKNNNFQIKDIPKSVQKRSVMYEPPILLRATENPMQDISYYIKNKPGTNMNPSVVGAVQARAGLERIFQTGNLLTVQRYGSNFNPAIPAPFYYGIAKSIADI